MSADFPPSALLVGHPGHELRLHGWLEAARPVVFVLTDGSGASGLSRIGASAELLRDLGCRIGPIFGRFTDAEIYEAILHGRVDAVRAAVFELAECLTALGIEQAVGDSCELYNPVHDLARVMLDLAVERARRPIRNFDYAVVGDPRAGSGADDIVLTLDDAALERKIAAAMKYPGLKKDVDEALQNDTRESFRTERLRMNPTPTAPKTQPYYEQRGEEQVREGRYQVVLRHRQHFAPFVEALKASVREEALA